MKKCILLFLILIAVLTLTLVAFACQEDRAVETAKAFGINISVDNGIVKPNELDYYNFSGVQTTTFTSPSSFVNSDSGIYCRNYTLNIDGSIFIDGTRGNFFHVIDIVNTDNSYFYLSYSYSSITPWVQTLRVYSFNTSSNIYGAVLSNYHGLTTFRGANVSQLGNFNLSTGKYVFYFDGYDDTSITLHNLKLEKYATLPSSEGYTFTGFVVPNYTYHPLPSPYDEWDGIVRPNLLSQTDFYQYPCYYDGGFNPTPTDVYYSNVSTSCFSATPEYTSAGAYFSLSVINDNNVGSALPSTVTLNYRKRLSYEDWATPLPLVYTLRGYLQDTDYGAFVSITLSDDRGHSVAQQVQSFENGLFLVSVPFEYDGTDYLTISVTLGSRADVALNAVLAFSKLEIGTLFTGFVLEEHNDLSAVNYNLLPNFDFENVPIRSSVVDNADNWVFSYDFAVGQSASDFVVSRDTDGALRVQTTNGLGYSMIYQYVPTDTLPDHTFNFALKGFTLGQMYIGVYSLPYSSESAPYAYFYFTPSLYTHDLNVSFPAYSSGCRIVISVSPSVGSSETLSWFNYAKLEYGSGFTGFVGEYDGAYSDGYDTGYSTGYTDGIRYFSAQTNTYEFNVVENNLTLPVGWSDLGFSSVNDLNNAVWSLTSKWYVQNSYIVLSSGTLPLSAHQDALSVPVGIRVYISRLEGVNPDALSEVADIYWLDILEHSMQLVVKDDLLPNDWLSYPIYRTVDLTFSRASSVMVNQVYGDGYRAGYVIGEDKGYTEGKTVGFNNGKAVGYSDGLKTAQGGNWYSLVTALIDVPVTTIVSFLDFDILGFNMLSALKTVALLSLFFFLIRFFVGKVL